MDTELQAVHRLADNFSVWGDHGRPAWSRGSRL